MYHNDPPTAGLLTPQRSWPRLSLILAVFVIVLSLVALSSIASIGGGSLNPLGAKVASADGGHSKGSPTVSSTATQTPTPSGIDQPDDTDTLDEKDSSDMDHMGNMGAQPTPVSNSGKESSSEPAHATPSSTKHSETEMSDDHESSGSEEMDMSQDHSTDGSDDHEDSSSEEHDADTPDTDTPDADDHNNSGAGENDMDDDHQSTGSNGHDSAGSEGEDSRPHGSEYEGPSDLIRNITLGGFAGINVAVVLAAALLKKKNPKKDKGTAAPNRPPNIANAHIIPLISITSVIPISRTTVDTSPTAGAISMNVGTVPVAAPVVSAEAPVDDTTDTADTANIDPTKGDDLV